MSLTATSIKRPIATAMVFLIIIIVGSVGFRYLPVDLLPPIEFPELSVEVRYPNTGPEEMELLVTEPLENALSTVANVDRVTSRSGEGYSQVSLRFAQGTDLGEAANDVREAMDRLRNSLPEDADPPRLNKFNPDNVPIVMVGVQSTRDLSELTTILERDIRQRFEQIPGIGSIEVWGGVTREVHVDVMRDRLLAHGLTMNDLTQAIRTESRTLPGGNVRHGLNELYVRSLGEYDDLEEIRQTVVRLVDGVPIRVEDVASVNFGRRDIGRYIEVNDVPMLRMPIRKQTGANTVSVARDVHRMVAQLNQERPDLQFFVMTDQSEFIQDSIDNVRDSAIWGGILAVIIMLAFFRNGSVTFIISVSIPIAIIATFGLLYLNKLTLNQMSFGGLALGVGMIVDNAIVVIENIVRLRQNGKPLQDAAVTGARQVTGAVIASTLTTCVIFLPVVFMQTLTGTMFQQLALVVVFSLVCSLLVALTLVPMLASRFLSVKPELSPEAAAHAETAESHPREQRWMNRIEAGYERVLEWALRHRFAVVGFTLLALLISVAGMSLVSYELAPETQADELDIVLNMDEGLNISVTHAYLQELDRAVRELIPHEDVLYYTTDLRNGRAEVELAMKSQEERSTDVFKLADDLRSELEGTIPGARIQVRAQSGLWILRRIFGSSGDSAIQIELRGYNLDTAERLSQQIRQRVEGLPGIADVSESELDGRPEQVLRFDRERMARLGVGITEISQAIQSSVGGTTASVFREGGDEIDIVVRLRPQDRLNIQDIENISVRTAAGSTVPVSALITSEMGRGPTEISHIDGQRVNYIYANLESGVPLGDGVAMVQQALADLPLPGDFTIVYGGEYEEQIRAQQDFVMAIVMALILIYMVMAAQFERFLDPLIVMFSVPLAMVGVVPTLVLTGTTLNMQSFMGLVMLIGIVVNNAIVLVDYINLLRREEGLAVREAVIRAGHLRLRPIMMTTLTTVLGLFPLALGIGAGAEMQASLARVVIGGLSASTLITLVFIPVVYVIANGMQEKLSARLQRLRERNRARRLEAGRQH